MRSTWHWEERRAAPRHDVTTDVLDHLQRDAAFASWLHAKQRAKALPAPEVDKPRTDAAEIEANFQQWLQSKPKRPPPCATDAAPAFKPRFDPRRLKPATAAGPPPAPTTNSKVTQHAPAQVDAAYRLWLKRKKAEDKVRRAAARDAARRAEAERARLHRDKWTRKLVVLAYARDA
ncbi:hypothetical protein SDRG_01422 [Saprolegnia diclina VS20]|uniref:Uncharacterized protein n=1 Tax=Saprolegnia diclina (strain VS20) TaxID=1156394 RepID=T0R531_SAPDV|nr:hypothetical protein SDRG_01422 [Saprolegnia diclina VS20]EQC41455.1 hypothetical protein SDRG_01422 [Saprolegnia diclina VS20]|eukprot:XP_008605169.1 hypothetical protein SDRG_01422 [Saprolegnia diclina VS20]